MKIRYGKALVRRKIVKITSGDVMTRVPVRFSRRSLAFYYGAPPRGFREHGNCSIYFQGTGDIFKLFSGNRGTLD